jgi:hypothetical protein
MMRFVVTFTGLSAPGNISIPGLKVGDLVLWAVSNDGSIWVSPVQAGTFLLPFVSTPDELRQVTAQDLSSITITALVERTATKG